MYVIEIDDLEEIEKMIKVLKYKEEIEKMIKVLKYKNVKAKLTVETENKNLYAALLRHYKARAYVIR